MMKNVETASASVTACVERDGPPLGKTRSLCPVCLAPVDASYRGREDTVWLVKSCPEHGEFAVPVWEGISDFLEWRVSQNPAQRPKNPQSRSSRGCPYDCGLCENHIQATCCVLLELTGRCDLGCPVCFASAGQAVSADPSLETIAFWYDRLMEQGGPFNIQLSGGEPTLRDDLPQIIRMGKDRGFSFFQLNTNGLRIARDKEYLHRLADAGLNTVFLQFDSLDGDHCAALRGRDLVAEKIRAVENCAEAALGVVLTPTIRRGVNDGDLWSILEFAADNMPVIRGVHFQPMSFFGRYRGHPVTDRLTLPALLRGIEEQSAGRLKARDFLPGGAEHPLCSFHANYTVKGETWVPRRSAGNSGCCGGDSAPAGDNACYGSASVPVASACCCGGDSAPASDSGCCDSAAVSASGNACCCGGDSAPTSDSGCCDSAAVPASGNACCCGGDSAPAGNSVRDGGVSTTSDAARKAVSRLWSAVSSPPEPVSGKNMKLDSLDTFIRQTEQAERETLAISGMAFQDAWTLDLARLSRCYIHVAGPDGALIPFCAYNLTSRGGRSLYRK